MVVTYRYLQFGGGFFIGDADHLNGSDDDPVTGSCVDVRTGNEDDHAGSRDHDGWNATNGYNAIKIFTNVNF